jgi:hypothetical protein
MNICVVGPTTATLRLDSEEPKNGNYENKISINIWFNF